VKPALYWRSERGACSGWKFDEIECGLFRDLRNGPRSSRETRRIHFFYYVIMLLFGLSFQALKREENPPAQSIPRATLGAFLEFLQPHKYPASTSKDIGLYPFQGTSVEFINSLCGCLYNLQTRVNGRSRICGYRTEWDQEAPNTYNMKHRRHKEGLSPK
jgi:hypothetical protein